jgi:hypothetical protein
MSAGKRLFGDIVLSGKPGSLKLSYNQRGRI